MTLFLGSARRQVEIRSIAYPQLSADEIGLLSWMATAQQGQAPQGCCENARRTLQTAEQLAAEFASVGLLFSDDMRQAMADQSAGAELRQ